MVGYLVVEADIQSKSVFNCQSYEIIFSFPANPSSCSMWAFLEMKQESQKFLLLYSANSVQDTSGVFLIQTK